MIGGTSLVSLCRECWHDQPFDRPEIRKTIGASSSRDQ